MTLSSHNLYILPYLYISEEICLMEWTELRENCPVRSGQMCLAVAGREWKCSEEFCLQLSLNELKIIKKNEVGVF